MCVRERGCYLVIVVYIFFYHFMFIGRHTVEDLIKCSEKLIYYYYDCVFVILTVLFSS